MKQFTERSKSLKNWIQTEKVRKQGAQEWSKQRKSRRADVFFHFPVLDEDIEINRKKHHKYILTRRESGIRQPNSCPGNLPAGGDTALLYSSFHHLRHTSICSSK